MTKHIELAFVAIKKYLEEGKKISTPKDLPEEFYSKKTGVFVSLHTVWGGLRGCIGTFLPTKENIAEEIIDNAISAATADPRFMPIATSELDNIKIEVSLLEPPEKCRLDNLNPKKYGVIVSTNDGRKGLLLPNLAGISSADEQVKIAGKKGGIDTETEKYEIERFKTETYK